MSVEFPTAIDSGVKSAGGTLEITTEPRRLPVSVDGRPSGISPLTVTGLTPGAHTVSVRLSGATIERRIQVEAGSTASLLVTMAQSTGAASGWVTVQVPASLQIFENKRLIGSTDVDRLMLLAGQHSLEFVNDELGFRTQRTVTVNSGATSTIRLELPQVPLSINAQPWAEVWIDGDRIGETPVGNVSRSIGRHEVVFRHPTLGERKATVLVTLKEPARIGMDLRKGS